ncbi:MAG: SpoIIE family protein phosphatase [Sneathiella sp.]|nr:SpoIIE family protein phosphatase [Sneathiella sp.]
MPVIEKERVQLEPLYWAKQDVSILDARILVVDDSPLIRELIGACLMTEGYSNVCYAENGQDALDVIKLDKPDSIILDLEMPVMDGFELCKKLRSNPEMEHIPILIQSGRDTAADITRAFDYGASDMVVKPIKKFEILARTKVHLEHRFFVEKLTDFHDRVASELEQARQLQMDICPSAVELNDLQNRYGLNIGWHFEPSSELGGDIGGIYPVSETKVAFFLADFSGHGVAAALNTFRLQTKLISESSLYEQPEILLSKLNSFLNKTLRKGSYATMLFGCIDIREGELVYASAGTQQPLLQLPENGPDFSLCCSKGMPLGLLKSWRYERKTVPFGRGARFILYSDALVEVECRPGELLGDAGLKQEVSQIWKTPNAHTVQMQKIIQNFLNRLNGETPDDLTIIYLENTGVKNDTE